jgi:hypothetical protein
VTLAAAALATSTVPSAPSPVETAETRAAEVRRRLRLATDALAVAHLLLGMNHSLRSVGRREGAS